MASSKTSIRHQWHKVQLNSTIGIWSQWTHCREFHKFPCHSQVPFLHTVGRGNSLLPCSRAMHHRNRSCLHCKLVGNCCNCKVSCGPSWTKKDQLFELLWDPQLSHLRCKSGALSYGPAPFRPFRSRVEFKVLEVPKRGSIRIHSCRWDNSNVP